MIHSFKKNKLFKKNRPFFKKERTVQKRTVLSFKKNELNKKEWAVLQKRTAVQKRTICSKMSDPFVFWYKRTIHSLKKKICKKTQFFTKTKNRLTSLVGRPFFLTIKKPVCSLKMNGLFQKEQAVL